VHNECNLISTFKFTQVYTGQTFESAETISPLDASLRCSFVLQGNATPEGIYCKDCQTAAAHPHPWHRYPPHKFMAVFKEI
jgi:hypothetical protein